MTITVQPLGKQEGEAQCYEVYKDKFQAAIVIHVNGSRGDPLVYFFWNGDIYKTMTDEERVEIYDKIGIGSRLHKTFFHEYVAAPIFCMSKAEYDKAKAVKAKHEPHLLMIKNVFAVSITRIQPCQHAICVYVTEKLPEHDQLIPKAIEGVPIIVREGGIPIPY